MKRTSIVRDWHALAQGDPQPAEGALVSDDLLRMLRDSSTAVEPQKIAVAIDPSGGGRDVAGVIGGFLGDDGRVWVTDDVSAAMSSAEWSTAACLLAYRTNAAIIYVEWNYGRDMCVLAIQTSWEKLQNEGEIPKNVLMPAIAPVRAKQGKLLRAEPIAQQMVQDKVRFRGVFTDMEREWATWQPTDPDSPGRIDASCILVYGLIPEANQGAIAHAPLRAPRSPASSVGEARRAGPPRRTDGGSASEDAPSHMPSLPPCHRGRPVARSLSKGRLWRHDPPRMRAQFGESLVSCASSLAIVDLPVPSQQLELVAVEGAEGHRDVETMALF